MPKVGNAHYAYTKKGYAKAAAARQLLKKKKKKPKKAASY